MKHMMILSKCLFTCILLIALHKVVMHFCCHLLPTKALPHDNLLSILPGVDVEYKKAGYSTLMESLTHDEVLLLSHFSPVIY